MEGEGILEKLRKGAAQRVREIEEAEKRADEYLAKFGGAVGAFLKDAVTIEGPAGEGEVGEGNEGKEGKRGGVIQ